MTSNNLSVTIEIGGGLNGFSLVSYLLLCLFFLLSLSTPSTNFFMGGLKMSAENNKLGTSLKLHFKCLNGTVRTLELFRNDNYTFQEMLELLVNKKMLEVRYGYEISKIKLYVSGKSNPEGKIKRIEFKQSIPGLFSTYGRNDMVIYISYAGLFDKNIKEQSLTLRSLIESNPKQNNKSVLKSDFADPKGVGFTLEYFHDDKLKLGELIQLLLDKKILQRDKKTQPVILSHGRKIIDLQEDCSTISRLKHYATYISYGTLSKTINGKTVKLEDLKNMIPENDKPNKLIQPTLAKNKIQPSGNLTSQSNPQNKLLQLIFKDLYGTKFTLELDCNGNYQWSKITELLVKQKMFCNRGALKICFLHKGRLVKPEEYILDMFNNKDNGPQFINLNVNINKSINNNTITLKSLLNENQLNNNQHMNIQLEAQTIMSNNQQNIVGNDLNNNKNKKGIWLRISGFVCVLGGVSISAIKLFGIYKIDTVLVIIPASSLIVCGLLLIFKVEIFGKLFEKPEISDNNSEINNQEQISIECTKSVESVPKISNGNCR